MTLIVQGGLEIVEFLSLTALGPRLAENQPLLGLDVGSKRIGVALSDVTRLIASPIALVDRGKLAPTLAQIAVIATDNRAGGVIVGLPIEMDGREGPRCQSIRQFSQDLAKVLPLPIAFWDERWSTSAVERMLVEEADLSRKRRRAVVDKTAAAYILQGALDALRQSVPPLAG